MIPLAAISHYQLRSAPLSINHQGLFVASTLAFNLQEGATLGAAIAEINAVISQIHMPASIHGDLSGTAQIFQQSLAREPILIAAAIATIYILLGMLYESYVHPLTILSTLPSARLGALLALMLLNIQFDIIGMIGAILLIGIVQKNAIIMIDFAITAERTQNLSARDAIVRACIFRFRPIMMTTATAIIGAAPLALSFGDGGEIRRPLGIYRRPNRQSAVDALHHSCPLPLYGSTGPPVRPSTTATAHKLVLNTVRLRHAQSRHFRTLGFDRRAIAPCGQYGPPASGQL
jgi:multidrug efflux pump